MINDINHGIQVLRKIMEGKKIVIIDPEEEYSRLSEMLGANVVTISRNSSTFIDPLELEPSNEILKEDIIDKIKNIIKINTILNKSKKAQDILEQVCLRNNLVLSDADKKDILRNF